MSDNSELNQEILKDLFLKILIYEKEFLKTRSSTHEKAADYIKNLVAKTIEGETTDAD
jgi:hypothetical protein